MHVTTDQCRLHAVRLLPGQDLRQEIDKLSAAGRIRAGFILSAVGSLTKVALRLANQRESHVLEGHFEIVSLTGTLGPDGQHLHLAVSDKQGVTTGGHIVQGCTVFTTVELVVGEAMGLVFHRETDPRTTFKELSIQRAN
jgi:predicted DNA-binding protein with PD1-like motif